MLFKRSSTPSLLETQLVIDHDMCHRCGACVAICPPNALFLRDHLTVDLETCTLCERCVKACPVHALSLESVTETPVADGENATNGHQQRRHQRRDGVR